MTVFLKFISKSTDSVEQESHGDSSAEIWKLDTDIKPLKDILKRVSFSRTRLAEIKADEIR
jgi:hypothetical protein